MFINDYWKKIINEIILIKESDIKIDDSAILVGGGGSTPNLALASHDNNVELDDEQFQVRKALSASNIQEELATSFEEELEQRPKVSKSNLDLAEDRKSSFKVSENFLTVPGGHRRTRAGSPGSADTASVSDDSLNEELNDDTITSLRQFIQVAKISQPVEEWAVNNLPGWSSTLASGDTSGARGDSLDNVRGQVTRTTSLNTDTVTRNKPERRPSVRSNMSRISTK